MTDAAADPDASQSIQDLALIRQILDGQREHFAVLVARYAALVTSIVHRHVPQEMVEDTVQDVFIQVFSSLAGYEGRGNFKHWLTAIAVRTSYEAMRKRYRNRERILNTPAEQHQQWFDDLAADESSQRHEELARRREAKEILDIALDRLCAEDRIVLELVHLEGYSGKEAARLLGWSIANVKIRAFRARKKMRDFLVTLMA